MIQSSVTSQEIVTYYNQCEIDYKWIWCLDQANAMHYGLWSEDTNSLTAALLNMNEFVLSRLDIQKDQQILDAGCGVGGTANYLADKHEAHVHGITLSQQQVEKATEFSLNRELKGSTEFSAQDFCNTNFKDENFDAVYAIESVCHANEKADFLKESYRTLKKGGHLVVAGFFATNNANTDKKKKLMANWADSWAVPAFEPTDSFVEKSQQAGFTVSEHHNVTNDIKESSRRLYKMFYPGIIAHHFLRLIFLRNKVQEKNVWSTYYQYHCLKQQLWEYRIIKLTK